MTYVWESQWRYYPTPPPTQHPPPMNTCPNRQPQRSFMCKFTKTLKHAPPHPTPTKHYWLLLESWCQTYWWTNPNGWGPKSSDPRGGDGERDFRKQCLETSLKENSAKKAHMRGRRKTWPQAIGYIVPRSFQKVSLSMNHFQWRQK